MGDKKDVIWLDIVMYQATGMDLIQGLTNPRQGLKENLPPLVAPFLASKRQAFLGQNLRKKVQKSIPEVEARIVGASNVSEGLRVEWQAGKRMIGRRMIGRQMIGWRMMERPMTRKPMTRKLVTRKLVRRGRAFVTLPGGGALRDAARGFLKAWQLHVRALELLGTDAS